MIPLNKPFTNDSFFPRSKTNNEGISSFCDNHFNNHNYSLLYSSRVGLQLIYEHLFKSKGSLRVGVSPLTCFDALFPIVANNHELVFIDINPETFNLDEELLINYSNLDVIQPIHLGGNPQRMDVINSWAKSKGVIIVEDCAQALGSFYNGIHVGHWGDFSVFSLTKALLASAGSLMISKGNFEIKLEKVLPKNIIAYKGLKGFLESKCSYRSLNPFNMLYWMLLTIKKKGADNHTNMAYSLPKSIFNEIDNSINYAGFLNQRRSEVTNILIEGLNPNKYKIQEVAENGVSNRNRLLVQSKSLDAKSIIEKLRKKGVAANNLTQSYLNGFQPPVSKSKFFEKYYSSASLVNYDLVHHSLFSIPNSPALSENEVKHIISSINSI